MRRYLGPRTIQKISLTLDQEHELRCKSETDFGAELHRP